MDLRSMAVKLALNDSAAATRYYYLRHLQNLSRLSEILFLLASLSDHFASIVIPRVEWVPQTQSFANTLALTPFPHGSEHLRYKPILVQRRLNLL